MAGERTAAARVSTGSQEVETIQAFRGTGSAMIVQTVYQLPVEGALAYHNPKGTTARSGGNGFDTPVAVTATSGTVLDAQAKRVEAWITNEGSAKIYLSFDGAAATTGCHPLYPSSTVIVRTGTVEVRAIAASGSHNVHVTEWRLP